MGIWLYRKHAIVVPPGDRRTYLLEHFHDRIDHGHFGATKTLDAILRYFYWDTIIPDVRKFINSCDVCERNKVSDFRRQGLLNPLPIPDDRFKSVSMDFGELPRSTDGFNRFLVLHDRLTKLVEIIPTTDTATAEQVAELIYSQWYLRGFGFPTTTVSDRDSRFLSSVWKAFCNITGTTQIISVSRHQQTNGGAESMVKMFKSAVRRMSTYNGNDWTKLRSGIQFAHNNSIHSATGFRPFYLAFGFTPATFPIPSNTPPTSLANTFTEHRDHLVDAHNAIHHHNTLAANQYDKTHRIAHIYTVGDAVWLHRDGINWGPEHNLKTSLLSPFLGPFNVTHVDLSLGNVTLELPHHMRIHNVFHVSSLKPWRDPTLHFPTRDVPAQPPPERIDDQDEFLVDQILDFKTSHRSRRYKFLIRWQGYDRSFDTWESPSDLTNCRDTLAAFLLATPACKFRLTASRTSARGGVRK